MVKGIGGQCVVCIGNVVDNEVWWCVKGQMGDGYKLSGFE
jgi:hypothetical protein